MKKIFLAAVLFVGGMTTVNAQIGTNTTPATKDKTTKDIEIHSFSWGATNATGAQTVPVPGGKGTLKFVKNGDKFTNVVFIDAAGKSFNLVPSTNGATNGGTPTPCKYPIPDACFGTADKSIGLCMCKPTDLSNGNYNATLLLPAVQKVREAAARSQQ